MSSWLRIAQFLSLVALLLLATGCPSPKPPLPDLGNVPDFRLTRETGAAFDSSNALRGKVWVADFIFTNCPGPCPRLTQHMKRVQEGLVGIDAARLVSFTVDPERDTPPVLTAYGKRFGADPARWYFLTGSREELHHLSKNVFQLGDVAPDLEHSTRFVLVDKRGRIRGYYGTSDPSRIVQLIEDAKRLVKE
jgi:protein SCO1/2